MKKDNYDDPDDKGHLKELEKKLLESYKHLGIINRRISILLEISKKNEKSSKRIIEFIVNSSGNFAQTEFVCIFKYDARKRSLALLASSPECCFPKKRVVLSAGKNYPPLNLLFKKRIRLQGDSDEKLLSLFGQSVNFKYFVFLPLVVKNKMKGALFLGFSESQSMATQELDFYEAFASQVASLLNNFDFWKR